LDVISIFVVVVEVGGAASKSAYYGYPELWILRYPAHRYHAVPYFHCNLRGTHLRKLCYSAAQKVVVAYFLDIW
jgi:hypothetical protein